MNFDTISAKEIDLYVCRPQVIMIDLRNIKEFRAGHILNAIHIPYEQLCKHTHQLPKDYDIILYCERGGISLIAAKELSNIGYKTKSVIGGINAYRGKYYTS